MKILYAILAKSHVTAREGTNSLIDIIEEINIAPQGGPVPSNGQTVMIPFETSFIALLESESIQERDSNPQCKFWIETISGSIFEGTFPLDFQGKSRYRLQVKLPMFPFNGAGIYRLNVECNDATTFWPVKVGVGPPTGQLLVQPEQSVHVTEKKP